MPFQIVSCSAKSMPQNKCRTQFTKLLVTNSAHKARQNLRTQSLVGQAVASTILGDPHLPAALFVYSISKNSIFHSHKCIATFALSFSLISVIPIVNNILAFSLCPVIKSHQLQVTAYAKH